MLLCASNTFDRSQKDSQTPLNLRRKNPRLGSVDEEEVAGFEGEMEFGGDEECSIWEREMDFRDGEGRLLEGRWVQR